MRAAAFKYFCDVPRCDEAFVTVSDDVTESYIRLTEAGWKTATTFGGWKHYCPEHVDPQVRKEAGARR